MRSRFDSQLALLNTELIQMGALCEEAISKAAKALEAGDHAVNIAEWVIFAVTGEHKEDTPRRRPEGPGTLLFGARL